MTAYIRNIIIVGIATSLALSALPKNGSETEKYVKYLATFLILVTLLTPLSGFVGDFESVRETLSNGYSETPPFESENPDDPVIEKTSETIAKYILSVCKNKFGVDTSDAKVKVILDDTDKENVVIKELQIYTSEKDTETLSDIEKYFSEMLDADVFAFGF